MVGSLAIRTAIIGLAALASTVYAAPHAQLPRQAFVDDTSVTTFARPGDVIECMVPNCERCEVSQAGVVVCKKCTSDYWQVNGECVSKKGCLVPDCQTCESRSDTVCKFCNPGFTKVNGACQPDAPQCPENCKSCVSGVCTECNPDFFITADGQCQACAQCTLGESFESKTCAGYVDRECTPCSSLAGGLCATCDLSGHCHQCADGYDLQNQQCVMRCPATCASCSTPDQCASCHDGSFLQNGECKPCTPCGEGHFESQACSVSQDRVCTACSALAGGLCQACTPAGVCQQCQPGYNLVGQNCVPVVNCPATCTACDSTGKCTACPEGRYLENGGCKACSDKFALCTKCEWKSFLGTKVLQCNACAEGYNWNKLLSKCEAIDCPAGQYPDGATCKPCSEKIEHCTLCNKDVGVVTCNECTEGFKPALGGLSCSIAECPECEYGSWRLNIPSLCSPLDTCKAWTPECSGFLVVEIVQPTPWMDRVCLDIWNTLLKPVVDNLTGNLVSIWESGLQCLQTSHPYQYCGCIGNMVNGFGAQLNQLNESLKNLQSLPVTEEIQQQIQIVTQGIEFVTKTMADLENIIGVLQNNRICQ